MILQARARSGQKDKLTSPTVRHRPLFSLALISQSRASRRIMRLDRKKTSLLSRLWTEKTS
eukprot:768357-Hanusia_phi.AAC.6